MQHLRHITGGVSSAKERGGAGSSRVGSGGLARGKRAARGAPNVDVVQRIAVPEAQELLVCLEGLLHIAEVEGGVADPLQGLLERLPTGLTLQDWGSEA